ncbi:MAG: hypothetical protein ACK46X_06420 [Candidatus Sericytochromatia bacterium]
MRWMVGSLLGLSVVLTSACQKAPSPVAAGLRPATAAVRSAQADFYPVTPGSTWEYQLHQRQANGDTQTRPMTIAIDSAKTRADGVVEAVTSRRYQSWAPPATRVLKFPDRVVLSRLSDPEDGPSITVLKLPLEPGAAWPGRPLEGGHKETIRAIGREAVTVPAGTFEAYRVDHELAYANGDSDTLHYWYAPGVGVVKMIERSTLYQNGQPLKLQVTGELERYTIGRVQLSR